MAKAFGILAIVLGIWLALEVYTEGLENAAGGALAFLDSPPEGSGPEPARRAPLLKRTGDAARDAMRRGEERVTRQLEE